MATGGAFMSRFSLDIEGHAIRGFRFSINTSCNRSVLTTDPLRL